MKSMKLILESWRKVQEQEEQQATPQEQEEQQATPQELAAASDTLEKASDELENLLSSLTQKIEQNQQKQETIKHSGEVLEESLETLVSVALIIPTITKIINFLVQKYSKNLKVKGYAALLAKGGHYLEKGFLIPFKYISRLAVRHSGVSKNLPEKEREEMIIKTGDKIAHGLFIVTIGVMAYHSGVEAFNAFQGSDYAAAATQGVLATIKGGEVAPAVEAVIANTLRSVAKVTSAAATAIVP